MKFLDLRMSDLLNRRNILLAGVVTRYHPNIGKALVVEDDIESLFSFDITPVFCRGMNSSFSELTLMKKTIAQKYFNFRKEVIEVIIPFYFFLFFKYTLAFVF